MRKGEAVAARTGVWRRHRPHNIPHIIAVIAGIGVYFLFRNEPHNAADHSALAFGLIAYLALAVYFAPAIIAYHRNTVTKGLNFAINLGFGWTLLGWVLSLAMAVTAQTAAPRTITITLPDGRTIEGKIE